MTSRMAAAPAMQHHQAVDADADAAGGREAELQGGEELHVGGVGLDVAPGHQLGLVLEALALLDGVVQLAVAVGQLAAADEQLEAVGEGRVVGAAAGEGGDLGGVADDEHRPDQGRLDELVVDLEDEPSAAPVLLPLDAEPVEHRAGSRRRPSTGAGAARWPPR